MRHLIGPDPVLEQFNEKRNGKEDVKQQTYLSTGNK